MEPEDSIATYEGDEAAGAPPTPILPPAEEL